MKLKLISLLLLALTIHAAVIAQRIGIGTTNPHPSAILEMSDSTHGMLIPRTTLSKRTNITNPAEGLIVYQTDADKGFWYYDGTTWSKIDKKNVPNGSRMGEMLFWNGTEWRLIPPGLQDDALHFCKGIPIWGFCPVTLKDTPTNGNLFLLGEAFLGGWSNPAPPEQGLARISTGVYEGIIQVSEGKGYLALPTNGDWTTTYYSNSLATWSGGEVNKESGIQFKGLPTSGKYKFNFNFNTGTFTVSFDSPILPTITTNWAGYAAITTAMVEGHITDNGGGNITARGICWSATSTTPTIDLTTKTIDPINDTGYYMNLITGLLPSTTYTVRSYATNAAGTVYGDPLTIVTTAANTFNNRYDGLYLASGTITDNIIPSITAAYIYPYNYYYLEAISDNAVRILLPVNGVFVPAYIFKIGNNFQMYSNVGTQLYFNNTSNLISEIRNYYGDPANAATFVGDPATGTGAPNYASSNGRYLSIDWSGLNKYDPVNKRIYLKYYIFHPNAVPVGPRAMISETLNYIGPR